jgi:hypothetical protein
MSNAAPLRYGWCVRANCKYIVYVDAHPAAAGSIAPLLPGAPSTIDRQDCAGSKLRCVRR